MKIDVIKVAKEAFKDKELIIEDFGKDRVRINYLAKRGNYNRKPFIFSKEILIDEGFIEGMALFLGDGDYHRKEKRHTSFASRDKDITKHFLGFLRGYFCIREKDLTILITYKRGNSELSKEWSNYLGVKKDKIKTMFSIRSREEACHIQVNGAVFRIFFEAMIKETLSRDWINEDKLRRAFLRGMFAAEGCIGIQYNDGKHYINQIEFCISTEEEELRNLICKSLDLEEINYRVYIYQKKHSLTIIISDWNNYFKLWRINIFDICKRKKDKFVNLARNLDIYLCLEEKFRNEFFMSLNMTQREIAKEIGSWQANVCRTVKGDHNLRIEQIMKLIPHCDFDIDEVMSNTEKIKIGMLTEIGMNKRVLEFLREFKSV